MTLKSTLTLAAAGVICLNMPTNSGEHLDHKTYNYTALYVAASPSFTEKLSTISFKGKKITSTDSSVIRELESCYFDGKLLHLKSSYRWLDFRVDLAKKTLERNHNNEPLRFFYDSFLAGNSVKILGMDLITEGTTVVYFSESKGILGFGLLGDYGGMTTKYFPPLYWLEGGSGICQQTNFRVTN